MRCRTGRTMAPPPPPCPILWKGLVGDRDQLARQALRIILHRAAPWENRTVLRQAVRAATEPWKACLP